MTNAELLQEVDRLRKRVAELKQTQETLHESENKWRSLLKDTPDIVMIVDRNGTIRFINHTVPGIKEQEAAGKRVYDYISPEHHEVMRKDLERVFQTGQNASQEISGVGSHGSLSWYQAELGPIRQDGRIVAASIVARDITERKRAEEMLRLRNVAIESSINGVAFVDVEGNLFYVNESFLKLWGYSDEKQVVGKPAVTFWADVSKAAEIREVVNNKGSWTGELVAKRKDGSTFDVELSASLVKDENANPVCRMASFIDITERKNTEQSLRENEERLRVALSAAQMGTWRWDPSTNQDTRDASFNGILGLEAVESTQPVDDFLQCVHPEDRDMVDAEIQRALREHRTYVAEFRIIRPDGTVRWLRDQGKPLYDENDHILCLTGAVVDITERKRAEKAIRESEQRYKALFQGATEGIIVADIETMKLKYVNPAICKMLDYTEEELKRLGVCDIHPKEDLEYLISDFKTKGQGERISLPESPCLRKDGTIIYANISTAKVLISGKEYNVGFFTNVTEHKQAEDALRESESKYRILVENLPQKIFFKDRNSVYISCNDNLAGDFKIKSEEIAGKTDYDFFPKELAEKYRADDKRVMESGEAKDIEEKYIQQGQEVVVHTVKTPVKDTQGNVIGILGIFWDITEHKKAGEELNEYREKMAKAERLASLGTLSATLAHELNQPLTAIRLSIENSLAEMETTSCPGSVIEDLEDGLSAVSDVASKVDSLRHFAQKSSKEIINEVNLKAVAERILNLLNESARRARVSLHLKGMDKLPLIQSNEKDLEQLFFALIENTIQAADGKKSRRLIISGGVKDEHIELRFADDCCGIAPENLGKIFEPFFTTRPVGERTGLGLCIVDRILSGGGGKIRVESKAGKGTTFYITLPINEGRLS